MRAIKPTLPVLKWHYLISPLIMQHKLVLILRVDSSFLYIKLNTEMETLYVSLERKLPLRRVIKVVGLKNCSNLYA